MDGISKPLQYRSVIRGPDPWLLNNAVGKRNQVSHKMMIYCGVRAQIVDDIALQTLKACLTRVKCNAKRRQATKESGGKNVSVWKAAGGSCDYFLWYWRAMLICKRLVEIAFLESNGLEITTLLHCWIIKRKKKFRASHQRCIVFGLWIWDLYCWNGNGPVERQPVWTAIESV